MTEFPYDSRVYHGILAEDFMATAQATKAPYLRVSFDDSITEHTEIEQYHLVRVPVPFLIYPLLKGDRVQVYKPDSSFEGYWLHSVESEIPPEILSNIEIPTGDQFLPPATDDTIAFNLINDQVAIITTRTYTILRFGGTIAMITENGLYQYVPETGDYQVMTGKFLLETKDTANFLYGGKVTTEANNGYELKVTTGGYLQESTGNYMLKSNNIGMGTIVQKAFELIADLYTKMGTFDTHTHVVSVTTASACTAGGAVGTGSGSAAVTSAPTGATPTATNLFKAQNVDIFFQE